MAQEYYQSAYTGAQFDSAIGRIVSGEFDELANEAVAAAQQAASNAEAAQSAYKSVQSAIDKIPAGSTIVINDLTTGGVTAALSAEQGKLLGRRPNPNLFDNWYFADPVDQRQGTFTKNGVTYRGYANTSSSNIYGFDRWRISKGASYFELVVGTGIKAMGTSSQMAQVLDESVRNAINGQRCTISALCNGSLLTKSFTYKSSSSASTVVASNSDLDIYNTASGAILFAFKKDGTSVSAIKLELGSTQTLAHQDADGKWVLNDIPNYGEEFAKCQRYMQVIGYSAASGFLTQNKSQLRLMINTPVTMRAKPTVTEYNISGVRTVGGANVTPVITEVTVDNATSNGVMITAKTETFNNDSYTNNTPIGCYIQKLVFDANL